MDMTEARDALEQEMSRLRRLHRAELLRLLGNPVRTEITMPSGRWYQVRVEAFWDRDEGGALRVLGTVDDGGWRVLRPLPDDFLVDREGNIV